MNFGPDSSAPLLKLGEGACLFFSVLHQSRLIEWLNKVDAFAKNHPYLMTGIAAPLIVALIVALAKGSRGRITAVLLRRRNLSLLGYREFYGDELHKHQHAFVQRTETTGEAGSIVLRPVVREIEEWADGTLTFLILSGEACIGKSRCCIEVANSRSLRWINVNGFKNSPNALLRGLRTSVKKGMICVYEDYQENRNLFESAVDIIIQKGARLWILSWEQEGPERAIGKRGIVKKIHLQKMAPVSLAQVAEERAKASRQSHLDEATIAAIVKISEGIPALTVLATEHYLRKGTLDGIQNLDQLMSSVYWTLQKNFGNNWTEIEAVVGKMTLARGISKKVIAAYYKTMTTALAGQVAEIDGQLAVQPTVLSDHIAKKIYFEPGVSPAFELALDELIAAKANEILVTLISCGQRQAIAVLLEKCRTLPPAQVISLGLSAYAAFRDLGFVTASLGEFWKQVWKLNEPEEYDRTAKLLALLGKWPDAEKCWKRTLELYYGKKNQIGVATTFTSMAAMYQQRGDLHQATDLYDKALATFGLAEDSSGTFGLAQTHNNIGLALAGVAAWQEAVDHFNKALEIYGRLGGDAGELGAAETRLCIGAIFHVTGEADRASEFFEAARAVFEQQNYITGMASVYRRMSLLYADKGDWNKADELFQKTLSLPGFVGDLHGIARAYLDFGALNLRKSNWKGSEDLYGLALSTYAQLGDLRGMGYAELGLAGVAYEKNDSSAAFRHYESALAAFNPIEDRQGIAHVRLGLGQVHRARADWIAARESYATALQAFKALGDKQGEAQAELALGSLYLGQADFDRAIALMDSARTKFNNLGNRLGVAQADINLGSAYHSKGKHDDAIRSFHSVLEMVKEIGNVRLMYGAYVGLGAVYESLGLMGDAAELYSAAFEAFLQLNDSVGIANTLLRRGSVCTARGEWDKAHEFIREALSNFRKIGNANGIARALSALGTIHYKRAQYERALSNYEDAIKLYGETGDRLGLADQYRQVGWIYYRKAEIEKAIEWQAKSIELTGDIEDPAGTAAAYINLGTIYSHTERLTEAIDYFEKGLRLEEKLRSPSGIATACNNLGMVYEKQGRLDQAAPLFKRALKIARDMGNRQLESYALTNIGTLYADQGEYEKANESFAEGLRIKLELNDSYGIAYTDAEKGIMYLKMRRWEDAERLLLQSAASLSIIGSKIDVDRILTHMSQLVDYWRQADANHAATIEARVAAIFSQSPSVKENMLSKNGNPPGPTIH